MFINLISITHKYCFLGTRLVFKEFMELSPLFNINKLIIIINFTSIFSANRVAIFVISISILKGTINLLILIDCNVEIMFPRAISIAKSQRVSYVKTNL